MAVGPGVPLRLAAGLFFLICVGVITFFFYLPLSGSEDDDSDSGGVAIGGFSGDSQSGGGMLGQPGSNSREGTLIVGSMGNTPGESHTIDSTDSQSVAIDLPDDPSADASGGQSKTVCSDCGALNPVSREYCQTCGATLVQADQSSPGSATDPVPISRKRDDPSKPVAEEEVLKRNDNGEAEDSDTTTRADEDLL